MLKLNLPKNLERAINASADHAGVSVEDLLMPALLNYATCTITTDGMPLQLTDAALAVAEDKAKARKAARAAVLAQDIGA